MPKQLLALGLVLGLLCACGSTGGTPDLQTIYERAARFEDVTRNPIVVIPGLLGSRLIDTKSGRVVWGAFDGDFADPATAEGARLMSLPMALGVPLGDLRDGVISDGALESLEVSVLGLPFELEAYRSILRTLGAGGYIDKSLMQAAATDIGEVDGGESLWGDEHFTCFQFDYDWRRGIPENASKLDAFLEERAIEVRAERVRRFGAAAGAEPVQFDMVCHSLGGLIARWYLRYGGETGGARAPAVTWEGARRIDKCVLIATPNLGSAEALSDMVHGMNLGTFAADYAPGILGTMPASYQLLPHGPGTLIDAEFESNASAQSAPSIFDPTLWRQLGWGLASSNADELLRQLLPAIASQEERTEIANDHLAKCLREARRVAQALDTKATRPDGLDLILFAGDAIETPARSQYLLRDGALWTREFDPGDGTVTRASALGDTRSPSNAEAWTPTLQSPIDWSRVTFLFQDHIGVVNDPSFVDNMLYELLEAPRR